MITFFTRLGIVIIVTFGISFFSGISSMSFAAMIFFVCIWISIRSFHNIFWWIVFVAFFYSITHYDVYGAYFICVVLSMYIFDFIKEYIVRSRYESALVYYFLTIFVAGIASLLVSFFYQKHFFFDFENILYAFGSSFVAFFIFRWIIMRFEKFVDLYTYGSDMKCHI